MAQRPSISLEDMKVNLPSTSSESSTDFGKSSPKHSMYSVCVTALDLVNHILIIALTVFLVYYSFFVDLDLHIGLCSLGYVLLMSEAILIFADESMLTNFLSRRAKSHIHWVLQFIGLCCVVAGVYLVYIEKTRGHFNTIHGILGITSTIVMIVLTVCGYPVFIAGKLRNVIRPVIIKFGHNFLGICCFVIGMTSQCYGYKYGWLRWVTGIPNIQVVCTIITALITILSVRSALPTLCRQFALMFR